jgi:hypothetical protein
MRPHVLLGLQHVGWLGRCDLPFARFVTCKASPEMIRLSPSAALKRAFSESLNAVPAIKDDARTRAAHRSGEVQHMNMHAKGSATFAAAAVVSGLTFATPVTSNAQGVVEVSEPSASESITIRARLSGIYAIKNKKTGRCADLPGFGPGRPDTPVYQYTCNFTTADNQRWNFVPKGQTAGGSGTLYNRYQIVNQKDGLCLDAPGFGDNNPGALVSEYTCRGTGNAGTGDNQRWYTVVRTAADGRTGVWIVNRASRLCLDVAGYGAGNDARLTLARCTDASRDDHYWKITTSP